MGAEAKIVELLADRYDVDPARLSPDARMVDLGLDSLTTAELIFDIEDAFGISIDVGEQPETFGDVVALVDRLIESRGG